ncbi:MAG: UMP kinase [Candidatus Eisenbacteria bacterium]|jgi:uridylate kinase|nr:UMP kinase [Candidatus Eisenbacteria bacterium]
MRYRRVLLKLSGESLGGEEGAGLDAEALRLRADDLIEARSLGVCIGVVPGGGNMLRGATSTLLLNRVTADCMGMLATVINALAVAEQIRSQGVPAFVRAAFPIKGFVEQFSAEEARALVSDGHIGIFAGGTGNPFFTTDTAAALRALEIGAEVLLKGTRVDGVFSADPERVAGPRRYERISYDDVLAANLLFMDRAAIALCRDNHLPVVVFNQTRRGAMKRVLMGDPEGTLVGPVETVSSEGSEGVMRP